MSLLETAIQIAVKAHTGQKEFNGHPYVMHPLRVMHRVNTDDEKIVAVLHDVIEDTKWTPAMLARRGFPKHLLDALACVTIRNGEPYPDAIRRAASNAISRRVKLADLEDNMDIRRLPVIRPSHRKELNKYLKAYRWLAAQPSPHSASERQLCSAST